MRHFPAIRQQRARRVNDLGEQMALGASGLGVHRARRSPLPMICRKHCAAEHLPAPQPVQGRAGDVCSAS
jgi:hypothetical protein